jgi:hypothetical protein
MINIIVFINPNYENINIINTVKKNIDIVSQFIILYNSIKKNWNKFEYRISIVHNIEFSDEDTINLSFCDIDIYKVSPDFEELPFQNRCACLTTELKNVGTHRLVLDCDMIALNEPIFDLNCDWQAAFSASVDINEIYLAYIIKKYNYKDIVHSNYIKKKLTKTYYANPQCYKNLYPYFNGGAILIKEDLCNEFVKLWKPSIELGLAKYWDMPGVIPQYILHIALQYSMSYALLTLSNNWKPFMPGFNYLIKSEIKINVNDISLLHYCGQGADIIVKKNYSGYFISDVKDLNTNIK